MADKPFRILLDVADLCLQNFKYVWINISPRELRTIADLKKCALHKLNLEQEDVQLFVKDGFLLDEETIDVLREDDTVKIKNKNPLFSKKDNRKRNLAETNGSHENEISKRSRSDIVTLSSDRNDSNLDAKLSKKGKGIKQTESPVSFENCSFTLIAKEKEISINPDKSCSTLKEKSKKQMNASIHFEKFQPAVTEENNLMIKSHKKKNKKKSSITVDQTAMDVDFYNAKDSFDSIKCVPSKQNKSNTSSINLLEGENMIVSNTHSLSKEFTVHNESSDIIPDINSEGLDSKKKPKRKRKRCRKPKKSTSDSFGSIDNFKSFSENVDSSYGKNQEILCLDDANKFQDHFTDTYVCKEDKSHDIQQTNDPKMSTPAQASNCSIPDWQVSLMPCKSTNLSYAENDSEFHYNSTRKNSISQNKENKSEEALYKDLPDLTSLPIIGTHIAYKALELDENYTPTATDYREGTVEKVNPKTEEIEIRLKKEIILPAKTGRFENLDKDEVPEPTVKQYDVLKWSNMISPKILSNLSE